MQSDRGLDPSTLEKLDQVHLEQKDIELEKLIKPAEIQALMDDFHKITGFPISIIDMNGKVLVYTGWQDICTRFHRVHPDASKYCKYSDVKLAAGVPAGKYKIYKCKNKMWHVATPIVVDNIHLGNILIGQFFFRDEVVDYEIYRNQARKYGFDEKKYLEALGKVPVYSKDTVNLAMSFYIKVAHLISSRSFNTIKLTSLLKEYERTENALRDSENKYREILDTIEEGYYEVDLKGRLVFVNDSLCYLFGLSEDQLLGKSYKEFFTNTAEVYQAFNQVYRSGVSRKSADWPVLTKSGKEAIVEFSISLRRDKAGNPVGFRGIARDVSERKKAEEKIAYLSYHDQLTGLYNRFYLDEIIEKLDTERRLPLSVVIADLNGLQLVNDTYGHATGDEFIRSAADILRKACREKDIIVRWGGDEFVIILPETSANNARVVCDRIKKLSCGTYVEGVPVSIALGSASKILPAKALSEVLKEAEDHMYRQKLAESRTTKSYILKKLLANLQENSCETEAHIRGMRKVARVIGSKINLSETELKRLDLLVALHDIGNITISNEVLTRKGPLSTKEWQKIKKHPEVGFRIARATEEFAHVAEDILSHHERWDGTGYPQGLQGEKIPLLARISAIADAFEVMKSGRPYKKALPFEGIFAELKRNTGTQFDPDLVSILLSNMGQLEGDGNSA